MQSQPTSSRFGPTHGSDPVVGIGPSCESTPPPGRLVWIPRIGEPVNRSHPWSTADLILLPLGVGPVDATLPVMHLGSGLPERGQGPEVDVSAAPVATVIWPEEEHGLPMFLQTLARGSIPIVPARDALLAYLCERGAMGLPCRDEAEARSAVGYLSANPLLAARMQEAGRRFARRSLSWSRVFQRLHAGLRALGEASSSAHVIVLNWNGKALLPDCLEALRDQYYPRMVPVMVDNGSRDGSSSFIRDVFPECRVLENRTNLGFAEGNNVGIRVAMAEGADYIVLLNNDTRVARGWLRALIRHADEDHSIGAAGSRMLFFDRPRTVNSAGGAMNQALYGWDRGVFERDGKRWRQGRDCLAVTGGSMLLRVEALRRAGLFDKAYFAYYEDNDLCHRIRLAGWRVVYVPDSAVFHKLSATSGPVSEWKTFLLERSRYRYILKNVPMRYLARYGNELLAQEWSELRSWWRAREYRRVLTQIRAAWGAGSRLPEVLLWRLLRRSGRETGWTAMLIKGFSRPGFPDVVDEFVDLYRGMTPEGRTITTCVCQPLRGDWSPVQPTFPKLRLLQGCGTVSMTNHRIVEGYLQIHLFLYPEQAPAELNVSCRPGHDSGVAIATPGWHTLTIPVCDVPPRAVVRLVANRSVGINEVSLLPADSPLLRAS